METVHDEFGQHIIAQRLLNFADVDSEYKNLCTDDDTQIRRFLKECPHKFVIGCVMDKRMSYKRAWAIPDKIEEHLGGFELEMLLDKENEIRDFFKKEKLHRHPAKAADEIVAALKRIQDVYGGDASKIWQPPQSAERIRRNFEEFTGVGPKISSMAVKMLDRQPGLRFTGKDMIDIAVDVHVRRVFGRTGLVEGNIKDPGYDQRIIEKARELNPDYPAALDTPVWYVGLTYCHEKKPRCNDCPLDSLCGKNGAGA